jgi:hypothetical protein
MDYLAYMIIGALAVAVALLALMIKFVPDEMDQDLR